MKIRGPNRFFESYYINHQDVEAYYNRNIILPILGNELKDLGRN